MQLASTVGVPAIIPRLAKLQTTISRHFPKTEMQQISLLKDYAENQAREKRINHSPAFGINRLAAEGWSFVTGLLFSINRNENGAPKQPKTAPDTIPDKIRHRDLRQADSPG